MKILMIYDQYVKSGVSTLVYELGRVLLEKGHEVYILEGFDQKLKPKRERLPKGIKVYRFPVNNEGYLRLLHSIFLGVYKNLRELNQKTAFDLVYLHLPNSALPALLALKRKKTPIVMHFYGATYLEISSERKIFIRKNLIALVVDLFQNWFLNFSQRMIQEYCLRRIPRIITFSLYSRKILLDYFKINKKKVFIVPGGVSLDTFGFPSESKTTLKLKMGLSPKTFIILVVSRLESRKGIDNLIRAMPEVLEKIPRSKLIIEFPQDPYNKRDYQILSELVYDLQLINHVQFLANTSLEQLILSYQLADIFVMCSKDLETFGMTMLESLACGTPVLGTPVGAIPEVLGALDKRLILEEVSPRVIAQKITWFHSLLPKEKRALKNKGLKFVKAFSWRKLASDYLRIFDLKES